MKLMTCKGELRKPPLFDEQHREAEGLGRGCLFLWILSFGHAKESISTAGRDRQISKPRFRGSLRSRRNDELTIEPALLPLPSPQTLPL